MSKDYMLTGGYAWTRAARMKGDPNKVAAVLKALHDKIGRVGQDEIKEAWRGNDTVLRETMGDEAHVMDVGLEVQAHKILRSLEYEIVNVRTEEAEPGGRVYQPVQVVTGDPDSPVRRFVEVWPESLQLPRITNAVYQPPAQPQTRQPEPPPVAPPAPAPAPITLAPPPPDLRPDLPTVPRVRALPPEPPQPYDADMDAWLALCDWRDRFGHLPRYRTVVTAMDALED